MSRYPDECTCQVRLADGRTAGVRAIRPEDAEALVAFHERLSGQTVYRRFFTTHPHLLPGEVTRFTEVDYADRLALVATGGDGLLAVARYDRTPGTDRAEVAFVVRDAFQGLGLGTLLLEHLAAAARRRGVRSFFAETLGSNRAMQQVFAQAGFASVQSFSGGIADVAFPISPTQRYLDSVLARHRSAVGAHLRPALQARGPGHLAVVAGTRGEAADLLAACEGLGEEVTCVLVGSELDVEVGDAIACLAAEAGVHALAVAFGVPARPRRLVASARLASQAMPVVARAGREFADLCTQAGLDREDDPEALVATLRRRLAEHSAGTWRPQRSPVVADRRAASAARDPAPGLAEGAPPGGCRRVDDGVAEQLLGEYGLSVADEPGAGGVAVFIDDVSGLGVRIGSQRRLLPLSDVDVADLLAGLGLSAAQEVAAGEAALRLSHLADDHAEVASLRCRVTLSRDSALVTAGVASLSIWAGPVRDSSDDPLVRRTAQAC